MKFKSPDNEPRRIALLDGRIIIIGDKWVEIPKDMYQYAYACGCISSDNDVDTKDDKKNEKEDEDSNDDIDNDEYEDVEVPYDRIKDAIRLLYERKQEGDFRPNGIPSKIAVNRICNARVNTKLFNKAYEEIKEEMLKQGDI